jgi:hypothetical protein
MQSGGTPPSKSLTLLQKSKLQSVICGIGEGRFSGANLTVDRHGTWEKDRRTQDGRP